MTLIPAAQDILNGNRRALARAVTLIESQRADHRAAARDLLRDLAPEARPAIRVGLSGTPGVGKSTFIEALGMYLVEQGKRVAVLAVDPSSALSGGAILGDKTRMPQLARARSAFIRPSPSRASLGGVAETTRAVIALCEAAQFDVVLVETVGVGQSETLVAGMTDIFTLLIAPAGGDELQGVKRGIMEHADLLLVNKADGPLEPVAKRTAADYAGALRLMRRGPDLAEGFPKAMTVSAVSGAGLEAAWDAIATLFDWRRAQGHLARRRRSELRRAFVEALERGLRARVLDDADTMRLAAEVARGAFGPEEAAETAIARLLGEST